MVKKNVEKHHSGILAIVALIVVIGFILALTGAVKGTVAGKATKTSYDSNGEEIVNDWGQGGFCWTSLECGPDWICLHHVCVEFTQAGYDSKWDKPRSE